MTHDPQIGSVKEIAQKMRLYSHKTDLAPITFLIGAGCSVSAGIPTVTTIAQKLVKELASKHGSRDADDPTSALKYLTGEGMLHGHRLAPDAKPDWGAVYDTLFAEVYSSPDDSRDIFKKIIRDTKPKINWAHLALGELAKERWVSTCITTNFDLLALEGYARAGVIPVVSDGIESLDRIDPRPEFAQLIQINGSIHTYRLRNGPEDLDQVETSDAAITCFRTLFQSTRVLVVVGYEGREPQIMKLLEDAAKSFPDKHIYWCLYSKQPKDLSANANQFLSHSQNARVILGQDADVFFLELCKELDVHAPLAMRDPIKFHETLLEQTFDPSEMEGLGGVCGEIDALKDKLAQLREAEQASERVGDAFTQTEDDFADLMDAAGGITAESIAEKIIAKIELRAKNQKQRFSRLKDQREMWYNRGREQGLENFLQVSILLAEALIKQSVTDEQRIAAHVSLAASLGELGERKSDLTLIEQSLDASRTALRMCKREAAPLVWAKLQNSLGNALLAEAEIGGRKANVQVAINAFRQALEERTREKDPLGWATTQMNLGTALSSLGNKDDLIKAKVAYDAAIEEWTRNRVPLNWALTHGHMASLSLQLYELTKEAAYLNDAEDQARSALDVYREAGATYFIEWMTDKLVRINDRRAALEPTSSGDH